MNGIIRFSLNNKFALWIMTIIVVAAGLYAGLTMKQETIPDINVPVISVTTIYPGAAPDEVAEQVTRPIEQRLRNLNGVNLLQSMSMENVSSLFIQYDYEKDMKEALEEAREAVDSVKLPEGASKPTLSRITINAFPVLAVSVSSDTLSLEELTAVIEEDLRPSLEGLDGVSEVQISGQYVREVILTWKEDKLAEYGLSKDTVQGIIQGSVLKAPLGLFEMENTQKNIVVDGGVRSLEDLRNLAIPLIPSGGEGTGAGMGGAGGMGDAAGMNPAAGMGGAAGMDAATGMDGAAGMEAGAGDADLLAALMNSGLPTVPLSEIADIELVGKAESISRTNGRESVAVQIIKAPEANTVEVVNKVKAELDAFQEDTEGLNIITMLDQGEPIEQSVATMLEKALFGAIFAVIIILLFLRNVRSTLIAVISIPMSLLIGILLLKLNNITLNIMTLGAMTVAIGRVVDDSIVVIENIYRRMSLTGEQLKGKALILSATKEMFIPIMSSTIVTIAVFVPLGLVSGMVGELFLPFALTMVYSLLASLLVAITIVPMLAHTLFKRGLSKGKHSEGPGTLAKAYQKGLRWALSHKIVTFLVAVLLLAASVGLSGFIGTSFLPEEEQKYAILTYSPAPGELQDEVVDLATKAEGYLLNRADVTDMQFAVGSQGGSMMGFGSDRSALFYVLFQSDIKNFEEVKEQVLADVQAKAPGEGEWGMLDMSSVMGTGSFSLTVYGDSYEEIKDAAEKIKTLMEEDSNFKDIETGLEETYDQYTLLADQAQLSRYGLTTGNIMLALAPVRERPVLTTIQEDGEVYNVYVQSEAKQYDTIDDMTGVTLTSPLGFEVPIRDVVKVESGESPNAINLMDGRLYTNITAEVTTADVGKASSELKQKINDLELPASVDVEFGGVVEQMNETFTQLGLAMAAAVAIVYLVLVITFGGGLAPFAILFSLPFTAIGAFIALLLAGETLNVSAMMGLLMLIGIVVTNAIVLIDRVIHKERDGLATREALIEAAGTRLRPILMTALATVGALLPMLFSLEGAGIISKGLAVTVIGGLTSSTLLTLFIVPAIYEVLMRFRRKQAEERI
ncbi:Acriflavin resistance protein, Transporter, AcrB/AcrD/AcrF family protein [Thermobacillus xylanilyticus]|uniref:Acriflavin resistance protein, Transporter, AcrB/AcrD/AcrF family protein n=1 Tax=Thermobacillus xylanilyticus TaxID=76633 RepID=A0ABM8V212_THEXY|nr:efflux RND transporter permease subunit [Thermobacillus xylanilyticus]CAG5081933.1 Acriflavin resistance protein, Transporter, AcrB/AcrD/AcrF family protein [Thermobacillus xylanilyticus]